MGHGLVIPAHVADKLAERAENCGNCRFWAKAKDGETECRRRSPFAQIMVLPMQGPLARPGQQAMQMQTFGTFAPTSADIWCGEWAPKSGVVR